MVSIDVVDPDGSVPVAYLWSRTVPCPNCADASGCAPCAERRTCSAHWRYLLTNTGSVLHLQCPSCTHVWTHESGFGATRSTLWNRVLGGLRCGTALELGDPVIFRHAKAGELAERFNEYLLVAGDQLVGRAPTYRGLGQNYF